MRFGSKFPNSSFTINDVSVPTVAQYKDVGVIISSNLSFTAHLNRILSKAYNSLGMIRRAIPSNCSTALKRTLYLTLVRSQVTYCSQVWRPYHIRDTKALERLQRRATKYVLNNYQLDYKSRLISLNLLPLTLWMELQDILFFLELLKNPPDNFNVLKYVCFIESSTRYSTAGKIKTSLSVIPRLNSTRHHYFNRTINMEHASPF